MKVAQDALHQYADNKKNWQQLENKLKAMQENTEYQSQSTGKDLNSDSSKQNLPSNNGTTLSTWYQNIQQLPFYKFKEVDITGNLALLIISGRPADQDLQNAWSSIKMQYAEAMGNESHVHYVNVYKEVVLLTTTYQQVQLTITALNEANKNRVFFEPLYARLNETLHTRFKYSATDFELNTETLRKMNSRSKGIKIQLDLKQDQLNALQEKEETKKPSEAYYQSILISLSDHAGFSVTDQISTYEFCERVRRMNVYRKELEKLRNGRR